MLISQTKKHSSTHENMQIEIEHSASVNQVSHIYSEFPPYTFLIKSPQKHIVSVPQLLTLTAWRDLNSRLDIMRFYQSKTSWPQPIALINDPSLKAINLFLNVAGRCAIRRRHSGTISAAPHYFFASSRRSFKKIERCTYGRLHWDCVQAQKAL